MKIRLFVSRIAVTDTGTVVKGFDNFVAEVPEEFVKFVDNCAAKILGFQILPS